MKNKVLYLDLTTLKGVSLKLVRYGVLEQLLKMGYTKYASPIQPYDKIDNIILQSCNTKKPIDFFCYGLSLDVNISCLPVRRYDTTIFNAAKDIDNFLEAAKNLFP